MATKKDALQRKACAAIQAYNEVQLRVLLSKHAVKKLIRRTGGKVLTRCLQEAIALKCMGCIEELLKAGANPGILIDNNRVMRAIREGGYNAFLKLLLENGANPDSDEGLASAKPLYIAAENGDFESFRMLLLYGADPDHNRSHRDLSTATPDGASVLGMCLQRNYEVPFVKLLIQFGANMYSPDVQMILLVVDNDGARLLNREKAHLRSLKFQCRIATRRWLKQLGMLHLIDQLEIPDVLVKYLQYHNMPYCPEKLTRYYDLFPPLCYAGYRYLTQQRPADEWTSSDCSW